MSDARRRFLKGALRRLGLEVQQLDAGCFVVQTPGGGRRVVRFGDGRLGVDLVVDDRRARRRMGMVQKRVSEYLAREQLAWVLRATETNLVLDVGGNVGRFGRTLRSLGYDGRIVSFEPVASVLAELQEAAAGDPGWSVLPLALGAHDGTARINSVEGPLSSMLPASDFGREWHEDLRAMTSDEITIRRLDSVLPELTEGMGAVRAYLKMDTQGFDLQVFEGAAGVLDSVVAMQSEVACVPIYEGMPRLPEQMAIYEAAGFEAVGMYPVSRDRPTLRVIEFDLLMVRPQEVRRTRD